MLRSPPLLAAAALLALLTGCTGLKLLSSSIGGAVERGQDLTMVCKVDPDGKKIYQAKWYTKDGLEFYRYQPGEDPPGKAFPVPGTRVNVAKSNESNVVLENVDLDTEGAYGCEITTEYPFVTVTVKGNITVVETPREGPVTSTENIIHRDSDDLVSINCTSFDSRPAVNLTWLINGEKTGSRWTTLYPVTNSSDGLQTSVLELHFRLRDGHFRSGVVTLKCTAELFNVYYGRTEVKVHRRSLAQRSRRLGATSAGGVAAPTLFPATLASGLAFIFARNTMAAT